MNILFLVGLFISFSFTNSVSGLELCKPSFCSPTGPPVRFPFRLSDRQPDYCGYPGFDLSCNNKSQLVLTLPFAGEFVVANINYTFQEVWIKPEFCLVNFNAFGSPFVDVFLMNYSFYNCSSKGLLLGRTFEKFNCASNDNSTIVAVPGEIDENDPELRRLPSSCRNFAKADIPVGLLWGQPYCGRCEREGGTCGFKSEAMLEIGCSKTSKRGLPTAAKYGLIVGVGLPGVLLLILIARYTSNRINAYNHLRRSQNAELTTTTIAPHPPAFMMGLDKVTIESFPVTVLGESKRLPKPTDSTCAICLAEYQPKDTLRSVPECNHYFHANCIYEWLRLNPTCPVCRNSPEGSLSRGTPMSSSEPSSTTSLFST